MTPSAIICKFGYIIINGTCGGNAICMDLNSSLENPRIVFADHSIFCDKETYVNGKTICWNQQLVDKNVKIVSESLEKYIEDVRNGELDIDDLDLES